MKHALEDVIPAYVQAFGTLDPDAVVPFYGLPCTFIAPQGIAVASDVDTARAVVSRLVDHARSQKYRRTEILGSADIRKLAANLASLTGVYVRFDSSDREIMRFGFTYLMRDDGNGWKIVVAVGHDVPASVDVSR